MKNNTAHGREQDSAASLRDLGGDEVADFRGGEAHFAGGEALELVRRDVHYRLLDGVRGFLLAERLQRQGVLASREDIFFLEMAEIGTVTIVDET